MNSNYPSWYPEAAKVLRWLEDQYDQSDEYYAPEAIARQSGIDIQYVLLAIANSEDVLEHVGTMVRFNQSWRIQTNLSVLIQKGYMREQDGQYSLTPAGEKHVQEMLKTNPEMRAFYDRLIQSHSKK